MSGRVGSITLALVVGLAGTGSAQQTCQVLRVLAAGSFQVKCGDATLLAITEATQRNAEATAIALDSANRTLAIKDSIIDTYKKQLALTDTTLARKNEYITALEELEAGYKRLADGYKKVSREKNLAIEGGIGSTGQSEPAILAGIAIRRLRIWGFLQRDNAGGMIGLNFPLF